MMPHLTFNRGTGDILDGEQMIVAYVGKHARARDPSLGAKLAAGPELLAALRIARCHVAVAWEELRDEHEQRKADEPDRADGLHEEDAQALAELEGHLGQIDAAIAKAEAA